MSLIQGRRSFASLTLLLICFLGEPLRAAMIVWGNSEVICDRFGVPMTGGSITLWKDGGNKRIDGGPMLSDDSQISEVTTSFSTNTPGFFYKVFDTYELSHGDLVYTRVYNDAGTYVADIGWTNIPPSLAFVEDIVPNPPWFYEVGGTRPDGKSWPPLTPTSFLEFGSTNLVFGNVEVGMTVTQQLSLKAWYYADMLYSNSLLTRPYYLPVSTNESLMAPGMTNVSILCHPTITGGFKSVLTVQYRFLHFSTVLYGTITSHIYCTAILTDTDGDQVSDVWENSHFGNLTTCTNSSTDSDSDGSSDFAEFIAGTNPTNATSVLRAAIIPGTGNVFQVEWPSVGTASYSIHSAPDLSEGFTGAVVIAVTGTPPTNHATLSSSAGPQGFYRISVDQ